jgi:hydrogenase 3 maturation protease
VVILGVGNPLRGDDGFGPALVARLKGRVKAVCLDGGSAPEIYAGKIVKEKPGTILMVDALHLGRRPGEYAVLRKDEIARSGFSTHDISPNLLLDYLAEETGAEIYMLGVQPESLRFGLELSEPVRQTLKKLEEELIRCMN